MVVESGEGSGLAFQYLKGTSKKDGGRLFSLGLQEKGEWLQTDREGPTKTIP